MPTLRVRQIPRAGNPQEIAAFLEGLLVDLNAVLRGGGVFLDQFIEGKEISDPAAPATNFGRLYFKDNGAGKTQLVARFPTGAVQVIATEP